MESYCLMGTEFQFGKMKRVLEMAGGQVCTTMLMHLMPVNGILKNN